MNTENTSGTDSQQPNSGVDAGATTEAANPNGQPGTDPAVAPGQGDGVDKPGSDAGNEGKPEGEAADGKGEDAKPDDKPALTGAPEAYEDFALPEGFKLEGDRRDLALALFRDSNLSQQGAQQYIDAFTKLVGEDAAMQQKAMEAAVEQQRDEWAVQAKAMFGDKYDAEVAYAKTAVQALESPELVKAFDEQGWGNHPELIKAFAFFGKSMRDSPIDGIGTGGGSPHPTSLEDRMYPKK